MICQDCGREIEPGQQTATVCPMGAPAYVVHARCGKVGTVHGREMAIEICPNCHGSRPVGGTCFQCGVGPRVG